MDRGPAGVNRLIGLYWLSNLFYPDANDEDMRATACDFYDKFYKIKLTNAQMEAMVRPAGVPPIEVMRPVGEPVIGLGTAPSGTKGAPGDNPAAPSVRAADQYGGHLRRPGRALPLPVADGDNAGNLPRRQPGAGGRTWGAAAGPPRPPDRARPAITGGRACGQLTYQYQTRPNRPTSSATAWRATGCAPLISSLRAMPRSVRSSAT